MKESTKRLVDDLKNEVWNKINENDKYIEKKSCRSHYVCIPSQL
jgi:hypothetical protein